MTGFTNVFGGSVVSSADVAYAAYSFSANLTLFWPPFSNNNPNIAARFMNLTATAGSLNVSMPDATLTSVGQDVIIFNAGSNTFNVIDYNGGAIATIAAGQTYYLMLNDNTTQAGGWQTVQFGVGTGSASAAALAGAGLLAIGPLLNVNFATTTISGSTSLTSSARAILQIWTGGAGTITLPTAASVGNGFFFPFANEGSGSVTIATSGGNLIDGSATSAFTQMQSAFIVSSGGAWYTVGKGGSTNFAVTLINLNVAGNTDVTETSAQAQNIIQQFTGTLTGNINVIVPATVQIYYVYNNTTGAFTLTMKTASGTGVTIPQSSHVILYCDGTNIVNAFTSSFGGGISISPGSATSPNLNFIGSATTGIYSPAANQFAVTANGKEVMNFISDAGAVNYLQSEATATGSAPIISAQGSDTNIGIILSPKGSGAVGMASAVILGGTINGTVIGGVTPAAMTGTTITANTGFSGPLTGNVTGNLTGNVTGNVTGNISGSAPAGNLTGTTLASNVVNSSITSVGAGIALGTPASGVATNLTGTAAGLTAGHVTTNANLTGDVTSVGNATTIKTDVGLAGNPTTTTQAAGNSTTRIATTAFVNSTALTLASGTTAITQAAGDSSTKVATTAFVNGTALTLANGTTSTTQSASDNSTKIATTAYADNAAITAGGIVLLGTVNASNAASVTFNSSLITSTYTKYILEIDSLLTVTPFHDLILTISTNNGGAYLSTNYFWGGATNSFSSTTSAGKSGATPDSSLNITLGTAILGVSGAAASQVTIEFSNPSASTNFVADWHGVIPNNGSAGIYFSGAGINIGTTAINNIKLVSNSGNITGNFHLYGLR